MVLLSGIPSLIMMPFTPFLIKKVDIRIAVALGLGIMALSAGIDTVLTADSTGSSFTDSQLLRGVGTILGMLFLNQAAISSVPPEQAGDAAGLFSAARNLGGSFALAGIATVGTSAASCTSGVWRNRCRPMPSRCRTGLPG